MYYWDYSSTLRRGDLEAVNEKNQRPLKIPRRLHAIQAFLIMVRISKGEILRSLTAFNILTVSSQFCQADHPNLVP